MFVNDVSGNMPIQVVGLYMIKRYGFDEIFSVNDRTINNFCKELELKYHPNPYHNSCHAADVMCSFLYIIHNSPVIDEMTSLELFASIVATLAHDVGHPARANRFLINTRDEIAIQYNDMSVLEMMHTTILFQILIKHENNIFSNLSTEK